MPPLPQRLSGQTMPEVAALKGAQGHHLQRLRARQCQKWPGQIQCPEAGFFFRWAWPSRKRRRDQQRAANAVRISVLCLLKLASFSPHAFLALRRTLRTHDHDARLFFPASRPSLRDVIRRGTAQRGEAKTGGKLVRNGRVCQRLAAAMEKAGWAASDAPLGTVVGDRGRSPVLRCKVAWCHV